MLSIMKKSLVAIGVIAYLLLNTLSAQSVGIGNTNPNPNALLEIGVLPGEQGLLLPRLKQGTIATLAGTYGASERGMLVYDADNDLVQTWDGTAWNTLGGGADNDWTAISQSVVNTTNRIGIGTNAPRAQTEIQALGRDTTLLIENGGGSMALFASAGGVAGSYAGYFYKGDVVVNERLGVGTVAPDTRLHIEGGNLKYKNGTEGAGKVLRSNLDGVANWVPHDIAFKQRVGAAFDIAQSGTLGQFNAPTPVFNTGGGALDANGAYRVPQAGYYNFTTSILLRSTGGDESVMIDFLVDGTPVTTSIEHCNLDLAECSCSLTTNLALDAGQIVSVRFTSNAATRSLFGDPSRDLSFFSGFLIHAK